MGDAGCRGASAPPTATSTSDTTTCTAGAHHDRPHRRHAHRRRARPVPVLRRRRADRALHRAGTRRARSSPTLDGYAGLLRGESIDGDPGGARAAPTCCTASAASPIGNSRVKLTNVADCVKRGLVQEGQDPLHVAAEQLTADGVDVLHTIGGDDTNTTAADLAAYLARERLRAAPWSACPRRSTTTSCRSASRSARGPRPSRARSSPRTSSPSTPRTRGCSSSTRSWAATAAGSPRRPREAYHNWVAEQDYVPGIGNDPRPLGRPRGLRARARHRPARRGRRGCAPSWTSSAASTSSCPRVPAWPRSSPSSRPPARRCPRDPFGHVQLDKVNPGAWFAKQFAELLGAEKTMVQKSGYFARSAAANDRDLRADQAVHRPRRRLRAARRGRRHRPRRGARRRAARHRVPADQGRQGRSTPTTPWFTDLLESIGQG